MPGGGIGACYDTWYGGHQLAGGTSGRVEHARIFSGSATDADGTRLVFDRIETPDLPACAEWEIRERQFVFLWKGSLPAYDYYSPEPCEYDVVLKGVYRTVADGEDSDGDGLPDHSDNCPAIANAWQRDADLDGIGDACDNEYVFDSDHDGIMDADDNCRYRSNPDQHDLDSDGRGDRCDVDIDGDGRVGPLVVNFNNGTSSLVTAAQQIYLDSAGLSVTDNCPRTYNPDQIDSNGDHFGDACQLDHDGDGVENAFDNCPSHYNPGQQDTNDNGTGDICEYDADGDHVYTTPGTAFMDNCPSTYNIVHTDSDLDGVGDVCDPDYDSDGDGIPNVQDNCPSVSNPQQQDIDGDGIGDACDADNDNDAIPDADDNCPLTPNVGQDDTDGDGHGDACDADVDNDGIANADDNCPATYNPDQADSNGNGLGDACFDDGDSDGIEDQVDNCPAVWNSAQSDFDGDGIGDACDDDLDNDGVPGQSDQCEFTAPGELVDPQNGCSLEQSCPCDSPRGESVPWRNKGKFVSCSARALNSLLKQRLITEEEKGALQSVAAQSNCGSKKKN
ncbi:thrombospondin type 3 repeat-containing protein [Parahaliea mediterranea]|uniref:Thrombospondin type 3 repeat-containing protein n=1 Tax=Parahaliea mediterranea TaxID=651086 RepID=A0A939DGD5_9GAMM|nr:thrombospondin type 3 repeat-containing protein [Parahaliea mediterranea]MBN7797810.1 thrombospondin type 3 repeat-containing protein [Parahaliea mediterranea]